MTTPEIKPIGEGAWVSDGISDLWSERHGGDFSATVEALASPVKCVGYKASCGCGHTWEGPASDLIRDGKLTCPTCPKCQRFASVNVRSERLPKTA